MKAGLGILALALGLNAAAAGVLVLGLGLRRGDPRLLHAGRRFVLVVFAAALAAVVVMEWALLSHDFSIAYVARNHSRATPLIFTVASLWGALEGSILLWVLILGGYLAVTVRRFRERATDPLVVWATLVGLVVAAFFFGLTLGPANPFRLISGPAPLDGTGPNPLLQNHPLMAFHPPMLYLGYVGFTVPFAFAVAALVTGRLGEGWLVATRRSTLVAWGFLTGGIVLGGWWSYEVLGWGGYWAWDPVENASLLPWLTATAYLHSVMLQEHRGMLRVWNLSLVLATFALTILGTFLTRSGIVNSVHAFSDSGIGPALLGFLAVVTAVAIGLIAWRGDRLRTPARIDGVTSREGAFLANNVVFAGFAFVVFLGTVFPLVTETLSGTQLSVGAPYFERMTVPLGLTILFLMAVAPLLPWRAASPDVLHRRLVWPAVVGTLTMAALAGAGFRGAAQLFTFGLGAFALAGIARQMARPVAVRRRATGDRSTRAPIRSLAAQPRRYGGLVVHVGVVLVAVALAASSGYGATREFRLGAGDSATLRGYRVTFLGTDEQVSAQKLTVAARVRVERGDRTLGVYRPALQIFPNATQAIATPAVRTGVKEDLYLSLISAPTDAEAATIEVAVNPMVMWLWVGGAVMGAGVVIAVAPALRRRRAAQPEPVPAIPCEAEVETELATV